MENDWQSEVPIPGGEDVAACGISGSPRSGTRCSGRMNGSGLPLAVFWDMDGTLIDSEPYWHQVEIELTQQYGGYWNDEMGWQVSGKPLPQVARLLREHGLQVPEEDIPGMLIDGVASKEQERMPWISGVFDLLEALSQSGVPSVLVTTSPRRMARAVVEQAPRGAFVDFVCGDDGLAQKPDPAPYLHAAKLVGVKETDCLSACIAFEDSATGIRSAVASGATTIAFTGVTPNPLVDGPQFASIDSYVGLGPSDLGAFVADRGSRLHP